VQAERDGLGVHVLDRGGLACDTDADLSAPEEERLVMRVHCFIMYLDILQASLYSSICSSHPFDLHVLIWCITFHLH
jgi:hypothetical protein